MQLHHGGKEPTQLGFAPPLLPCLLGNNADTVAKRAIYQLVTHPKRELARLTSGLVVPSSTTPPLAFSENVTPALIRSQPTTGTYK